MPSLLALLGACGGTASSGSVQIAVNAPSNTTLNPLQDPRLSSIELRSLGTSQMPNYILLGDVAVDAGHLNAGASLAFPAPGLMVEQGQDLSLVALGSEGQQVLGLAITRDQTISYGTDQTITFNMRRPLFFFGGSNAFVWTPPSTFGSLTDPNNANLSLLPNSQLYAGLSQNQSLWVLDPNSATPLLDIPLVPSPTMMPVAAAAGTSDGLTVAASTLDNTLHLIDTSAFDLMTAPSIPIANQPPPGAMVVNSTDQMLAVLNFNHFDTTPPKTGVLGSITAVRNLSAVRAGSAAPDIININVMSDAGGPPIAAAFEPPPSTLLDVVFGAYPVTAGQTDCTSAAVQAGSLLRSYDLSQSTDGSTGVYQGQATLPYTTGIVYGSTGQRVLVQPCETPTDPGTGMAALRPGQVVIAAGGGNPALTLPAPGTAAVAVAGQPSALVAVGRDQSAVSTMNLTPAQGAVRVLVSGDWKGPDWTSQSTFALDPLDVPQIIPVPMGAGGPQPDVEDVIIKARDVLIYQIRATPDQALAVVAARITYSTSTQGVYLGQFVDNAGDTETCYLQWQGYGYYVFVVNLQTGAREQDWMVGVQTSICNAGVCQSYCDDYNVDGGYNLNSFAQGYIPTAVSALFSGQ